MENANLVDFVFCRVSQDREKSHVKKDQDDLGKEIQELIQRLRDASPLQQTG